MKKWQIIAPIGIAAAVAAALAVSKKPADKAAPKAKEKAKTEIKNPKTGTYSFVSGYKDAVTVELSFTFDGDKVDYNVIEEEFLTYSSDSHVAVVYSGAFSMQLEYASYYGGEDFAAFSESVKDKYRGFGKLSYNGIEAVKYLAGDAMCVCIPVDENSYLLATMIKGPEYDGELVDLPESDDVKSFLGSMKVEIK